MIYKLLFVFLVCSSCSLETYYLEKGTYNVKSDCPDAEKSEGTMRVTSRGLQLTTESGLEFDNAKEFGLPENIVDADDTQIFMENELRTCIAPLHARATRETMFYCQAKTSSVETCKVYISFSKGL